MEDRVVQLEKEIMKMLLEGDLPTLRILREQFRLSNVSDRRFSGVGFFTDFEVPDGTEKTDVKSFRLGDVIAEIDHLKHGAGFLLFVENGVISMLEGFCYDENWPETIEGFKLSYINGPERDLIDIEKDHQQK